MKQIQLEFYRKEGEDGKFRTRPHLILSGDFSTVRHRGLLHKVYYSKDRIRGDTPSVTRKLNSIQPETFKGKVGLSAAKGSYKIFKASRKAVFKTALAAETVAISAAEKGVEQYKEKLKTEIDNQDTAKAFVKAGNTIAAVGRHIRQKSRYNVEKKRLYYRKEDFKLIQEKTAERLLKEQERLSAASIKYRKFKESFEVSNKSNIRRMMLKRRKQVFKEAQKSFKRVEKAALKLDSSMEKRVKNQEKITKLTKPHSIPVKGILKATDTSRNKLADADENNDLMKAADKTVRMLKTVHAESKEYRLRRYKKRDNKYQKSANSQQGKLKQEEYKLSKEKRTPRNNVKRRKKYKQRNQPETFSDYVKSFVSSASRNIRSAVKDVGAKLLIIFLPVIIFLIIFGMGFMVILGIFSETGWMLGTYTANDSELSDAVTYYTLKARNFNNNIIDCGSDRKWKKALKALGATDLSQYTDTPDEFVYGKSVKFSYEPANYDFDPFVLWSFLCAYHYDFKAADEAHKKGESYEPDKWTFEGEDEDVIDELFDAEYSFEFEYNNTSYWSELPYYTVKPEKSGLYYTVYDDFSHSAIRLENAPGEIWNFSKDGWIHYDENTLEILDANNSDNRTGWFIQDQRIPISKKTGDTRSAFYHWYDRQWCWGSSHNPRGSYAWSNTGKEIYFVVTPGNTEEWNSNLSGRCLISFYKKYSWCPGGTLYYTVKQNCTFEEAVVQYLSNMDYADERIEYYDLLAGNTSGSEGLNGNHQLLSSPLDQSLSELIENNRIFNGYGYDVQNWNETHCSIKSDPHNALDIYCNTYNEVYAMCDGEITAIDYDENTIQITSDEVEFWYESSEHKLRLTYCNVKCTDNLNVGDIVSKETIIGNPTANHLCEKLNNVKAGNIYIHLKVEIKYYKSFIPVDPRLLFY